MISMLESKSFLKAILLELKIDFKKDIDYNSILTTKDINNITIDP